MENQGFLEHQERIRIGYTNFGTEGWGFESLRVHLIYRSKRTSRVLQRDVRERNGTQLSPSWQPFSKPSRICAAGSPAFSPCSATKVTISARRCLAIREPPWAESDHTLEVAWCL